MHNRTLVFVKFNQQLLSRCLEMEINISTIVVVVGCGAERLARIVLVNNVWCDVRTKSSTCICELIMARGKEA